MAPRGSRKPKSLPIPGSSTYPGKPEAKGAGLEAPQWAACRKILEGVYNTTEDGILVAEIFCQLPDRTDFADYFETIPEPECLDNVATLLDQQAFPTPDKFFAQLLLIFLNAKHYNEDGSQLYEDASAFEEQIWAEWRKYAAEGIFKGEPHLPKTQTRKGKRVVSDSTTAKKASSSTPIPAPIPLPTPAPPPIINAELPKPILTNPAVASSSRISRSAPSGPMAQTPNHPPIRGLTVSDQRIVNAVDAKMPRWHGPMISINGASDIGGVLGSGWWGDNQPEYEFSNAGKQNVGARVKSVLAVLLGYRDDTNLRLSDTLESVPPLINLPYLSFNGSISLAAVRHRSDRGEYRSVLEADMDMVRLFERARRWYAEGTTEYGHILTLQRLYNALTSITPLTSSTIPPPSTTNFASISGGPGRARPASDTDAGPLGITQQKVNNRDRTFITEARYKGVTYKVGDYVHLINPDDATRPIVGQIFKAFVPTRGTKKHHISVCWYYRPEQTVHTAEKMFLEREVLKTGHICDHPVEDIIEKVSCQFFVKYVRGRSRAGEYYPGWPLYVCLARYNDKKWAKIDIKNWASCIPEELRQTTFMTHIPFDRIIDPIELPSPLLNIITKVPGFIAEPRGLINEDDDEEKDKVANPAQQHQQQLQQQQQQQQSQSSRSSVPTPASHSIYRPPVPIPQTNVGVVPNSQAHRQQSNLPVQTQNQGSGVPLRTFGAMYGGQQAMDQIALKEHLPIETTRLFDRDVRQAVLWFSGPPLPSTQESSQPQHSLEYLAWLVKKRKRAQEDEGDKGEKSIA